ncbi:hypothetical protein BDF14DRAFT_1797881 [Spinellus fusiger]|nr:hypothetical protein BDF14DRAFT_1797881 [Spinellus fusiger]
MTHQSLREERPRASAFEWPIPSPSAHTTDTAVANDISLQEILSAYQHEPELLRHILAAKTAEDKKRAAHLTLKTEMARIQLRRMDMELMHEQEKHTVRDRPTSTYPPIGNGTPYSHLAPIQQQVMARFTHGPEMTRRLTPMPLSDTLFSRPPTSPVYYPHSAHPLCRSDQPSTHSSSSPTRSLTLTCTPHSRLLHSTSTTSTSTTTHTTHTTHTNALDDTPLFPKRSRASFSAIMDKDTVNTMTPIASIASIAPITPIASTAPTATTATTAPTAPTPSRDKVMEALKAKIQRGTGVSSASEARRLSCIEPNEQSLKYRTLPKAQQFPYLHLRHGKTVERRSIEPLSPLPHHADSATLPPMDPPRDTSQGKPASPEASARACSKSPPYAYTTPYSTSASPSLSTVDT